MSKLHGTPPGAARLQAYIAQKYEGNVSAFCRAHGLDRVHIVLVLKGRRTRINANLIRDLHRASNGDVPWWSWTTDGVAPEVEAHPAAAAA